VKKVEMNDNLDKQEKFKRLAEKRVNNAIRVIKAIGNLSNKRNYSFHEKQVKKIVSALRRNVKEIENAFLVPEKKNSGQFKL
jgi:hypothetical protein